MYLNRLEQIKLFTNATLKTNKLCICWVTIRVWRKGIGIRFAFYWRRWSSSNSQSGRH